MSSLYWCPGGIGWPDAVLSPCWSWPQILLYHCRRRLAYLELTVRCAKMQALSTGSPSPLSARKIWCSPSPKAWGSEYFNHGFLDRHGMGQVVALHLLSPLYWQLVLVRARNCPLPPSSAAFWAFAKESADGRKK